MPVYTISVTTDDDFAYTDLMQYVSSRRLNFSVTFEHESHSTANRESVKPEPQNETSDFDNPTTSYPITGQLSDDQNIHSIDSSKDSEFGTGECALFRLFSNNNNIPDVISEMDRVAEESNPSDENTRTTDNGKPPSGSKPGRKVRMRKCKICGFISRNHLWRLREHAQIHTNIKMYECSFCGYKVRYISNIRSHAKVHHPDDISSALYIVTLDEDVVLKKFIEDQFSDV